MEKQRFVNINVMSLQYFIAAAESESFSQAAAKLHTAQPNISRHIQNLEQELGVELFTRTPQKSRLTPVGEQCLEAARRITALASSMYDSAEVERQSISGHLRIGYTGSSCEPFLREHAQAFQARHPRVEVSLQQGEFGNLRRELMRGELDLLCTFANAFEGDQLVEKAILLPATLRVVVRKDHPLAGQEVIPAEALQGEHVILSGKALSSMALNMSVRHSQQEGIFPDFIYDSYQENLPDILERVRAGEGLLLTSFWVPSIPDDQLSILTVDTRAEMDSWAIAAVWEKKQANRCRDLFIAEAKAE